MIAHSPPSFFAFIAIFVALVVFGRALAPLLRSVGLVIGLIGAAAGLVGAAVALFASIFAGLAGWAGWNAPSGSAHLGVFPFAIAGIVMALSAALVVAIFTRCWRSRRN